MGGGQAKEESLLQVLWCLIELFIGREEISRFEWFKVFFMCMTRVQKEASGMRSQVNRVISVARST